MNKSILLGLMILSVQFLSAQTKENEFNDSDIVFTSAQISPKFTEGTNGWRDFLVNNLNTTVPAKNGARAGKYTVIISYVVDKDGNVKNVSANNNPGYGMAEEAIRIIKNSPKWIPASQNGYQVAFRSRQAITFVVGETSATEGNVYGNRKFPSVQIEAEFPGGRDGWKNYLERNLNISVASSNGAPPGRYSVTIDFLVANDGHIVEANALNNPGYGTAEEALRMLKRSPNWKPAVQNGVNVAYRGRQVITFVVSNQ